MRRRTRSQATTEVKTDGWLAIFGDLTSLMLTFFVLLMSMSTIDKTSLKQITQVMQSSGSSVLHKGQASKGASSGGETRQELLLATRQRAIRMFKGTSWRHRVHVQIVDETMLFSLPAALLFAPGRAALKPSDVGMLRRMAFLLQLVPGDIRVEGHAYREHLGPESPYHNDRELSLARAASVLHVLLQAGVEDRRLSLAGYGDAHPVTTRGNAGAMARNRRVDIVLYRQRVHGPAADAAGPN